MSEPPNIDLELTGLQRATLSSLLKREEAIQPPEWLSVEAAIDDESERARAAADPEAFWAPSRPAASEPPQDPLGQDRPPLPQGPGNGGGSGGPVDAGGLISDWIDGAREVV